MLLHFHSDWNTHRPGWEVSYTTNYERINLDIKVFLEGPFLDSGMSTDINALLPHNQPYDANSLAQWYYEGDETVDPIPGSDIVDWIIVELRDSPVADSAKSNTIIARKPVFLISDGTVVSLDGSIILQFSNSITQQLFVVVRHRNHLAIMSNNPITQNGGVYTYDFSDGQGQAFGMNSQKNLGSEVYGMISGDSNGDGNIDIIDKIGVWELQAGKSDYLTSDLNMDGQINNKDKDDVWLPNTGLGSQVP